MAGKWRMDTVTTKMGDGGRVIIPAEIRKQCGIKVGDTLNITAEDDELIITTPRMALRRLQKRFRSIVPEGVSVVDEFIAERRKEAENE